MCATSTFMQLTFKAHGVLDILSYIQVMRASPSITLFRPIAMLSVFCKIFLTFRLNVKIFHRILSNPYNVAMGPNNVMSS